MKYSLYQNRSIRTALERGTTNDWDALFKVPGCREEQDVAVFGAKKFDCDTMSEFWDHVADIEAENIDMVFEIGNIGPESRITRYNSMRSISVGDIVVDENGQSMMVDAIGWSEIEFIEPNKYGSLAPLI